LTGLHLVYSLSVRKTVVQCNVRPPSSLVPAVRKKTQATGTGTQVFSKIREKKKKKKIRENNNGRDEIIGVRLSPAYVPYRTGYR